MSETHSAASAIRHKGRKAVRHQNFSRDFLADAVNRLDAVFDDLSHHSGTTPKALAATMSVSG